MFVLEVTAGPLKGQAIELVHGVTLQIGRSRACTIHFDSLEVSGRHAAVRWDDEGFTVSDLGSRNGTYVNGTQAKEKMGLRLGDFIQVGSEILQLKEVAVPAGMEPDPPPPPSGQTAEAAPAPKRKSKILAFDTTATMVGDALALMRAKAEAAEEDLSARPNIEKPQRAPPPAAETAAKRGAGGAPMLAFSGQKTTMAAGPMKAAVAVDAIRGAADLAKVLSGPTVGNARVVVRVAGRLDHFATLPVSLGREHSSGLRLDDDAASLSHAVLDHREGKFVVRDVGSTNGTYVNGQRIVVRPLENGDIIGIGTYTLLVVLVQERLGLEVRTADIAGEEVSFEGGSSAFSSSRLSSIGMIKSPLGEMGKKRKKASELVWFATSDLDRGVFRARSALLGLILGTIAAAWMLAKGDSEVLAGGKLMFGHESTEFDAKVAALGRAGCAACHVGIGRVAALRCFDCHDQNRPDDPHADETVSCARCHQDHRGAGFKSAASAAVGCTITGCHPTPHTKLIRLKPKLVANFKKDAEADVDFHLFHLEKQGVLCLNCHAEAFTKASTGVRSACGQCHAPDHVAATDCSTCHRIHPDRHDPISVAAVAPEPPPRFPPLAAAVVFPLLVLPFFVAALIPRKRRVQGPDPATGGEEPRAVTKGR